MTCLNSDIKLFVRLEPDAPKLTHQNGIEPAVNPRTGKPLLHKTSALLNLEAKYIALLKPHAPPKPWNCPIHLTTVWHFRSATQTGWKTTAPDTDNVVKTLKDCMTKAGFYKDDALVCLETIAKLWAAPDAKHGVEIRLHDLTNDEP